MAVKLSPKSAQTSVATYYDPTSDAYERTAIVINEADAGSVDVLVRRDGRLVRVCQINATHFAATRDGEEHLIVDVIDVDDRYSQKRAMSFAPSERWSQDVPKGGNLVSTDFRIKLDQRKANATASALRAVRFEDVAKLDRLTFRVTQFESFATFAFRDDAPPPSLSGEPETAAHRLADAYDAAMRSLGDPRRADRTPAPAKRRTASR